MDDIFKKENIVVPGEEVGKLNGIVNVQSHCKFLSRSDKKDFRKITVLFQAKLKGVKRVQKFRQC